MFPNLYQGTSSLTFIRNSGYKKHIFTIQMSSLKADITVLCIGFGIDKINLILISPHVDQDKINQTHYHTFSVDVKIDDTHNLGKTKRHLLFCLQSLSSGKGRWKNRGQCQGNQ